MHVIVKGRGIQIEKVQRRQHVIEIDVSLSDKNDVTIPALNGFPRSAQKAFRRN